MATPTRSPDTTLDDESIETMTREEGLCLLNRNRQARKYLGMSGREFIVRYKAGEIEDPYRLEVARVAMLLPLAEL